MAQWLQSEWHKVIIAALFFDHLWDRLVPLFEKYGSVKEYVERRYHDRRNSMNFINGIVLAEKEAVLLNEFLIKLPTYLPLIQKNIADLSKASGDRNDPVALMTDVSALLDDLNKDLATLSVLVPTLNPTTTVVPPPAV
jgi:hypothetical protein